MIVLGHALFAAAEIEVQGITYDAWSAVTAAAVDLISARQCRAVKPPPRLLVLLLLLLLLLPLLLLLLLLLRLATPPPYQPPGASTHRHRHHQRNDSCRRCRGSGPLSVTGAEVADAHLP